MVSTTARQGVGTYSFTCRGFGLEIYYLHRFCSSKPWKTTKICFEKSNSRKVPTPCGIEWALLRLILGISGFSYGFGAFVIVSNRFGMHSILEHSVDSLPTEFSDIFWTKSEIDRRNWSIYFDDLFQISISTTYFRLNWVSEISHRSISTTYFRLN